jgi:hypothetical protein
MVKPVWHWLVGHDYRWKSASFQEGSNRIAGAYASNNDEKMTVWGFTQLVWVCGCGHVKTIQVIGNHCGTKPADQELADLKKMAGL